MPPKSSKETTHTPAATTSKPPTAPVEADVDTFLYKRDRPDTKLVEETLVVSFTPTTVKFGNVTLPITESGWEKTNTSTRATVYTEQDLGFDRTYILRFLVERSNNSLKVGDNIFYKQVPSLNEKASRYLDASTVEVKAGQTWSSIARENKLTVNELLRLNGKSPSDILHRGQLVRVY